MENLGLIIVSEKSTFFENSTDLWLHSTEENFYSCFFYLIDDIFQSLLTRGIDLLNRFKVQNECF